MQGHAHFDVKLMKQLRVGRRWTLRDMARETGVSCPYLSQLETGKVTNPSLGTSVAIADAFRLSVETFVLRGR